MTRVLVIGAGRVGRLVAADLASDPAWRVYAADASPQALQFLQSQVAGVEGRVLDVDDAAALREAAESFDLLISAVPGRLGRRVQEAALDAGKDLVDVAFAPEDPWDLEERARRAGIRLAVDCGVAPGLSNLFAGHAEANLAPLESLEIYVGGLPKQPVGVFGYRAPFHPEDVVEEYTRPCTVVHQGRPEIREPLTELETLEVPGLGRLEAFLTDGLRTLVRTLSAREMREKTLRHPGHADRIRLLRDAGFLDPDPLDLGAGRRVSPREVTVRVLERAWRPEPGEPEFTFLRVVARGTLDGAPATWVYEAYDETDDPTGYSSMARSTAFPCALTARSLARRPELPPGLLPMERLARDPAVFTEIVDGLRARGIRIRLPQEASGRT